MDSSPSSTSAPSATFFARFVKPWLSLVLSLAVIAAGLSGYVWLASLKQPPQGRAQTDKVYAVEVFDVEAVDLQRVLSAFGTARAEREVLVAAQVSGEVVEVLGTNPRSRLKVGQHVSEQGTRIDDSGKAVREGGDLLVRIDPRNYQQRVAQLESLLEEDAAELKRIEQEQANNEVSTVKAKRDFDVFKRDFDRAKGLYEQGALSATELVKAQLELNRYEDALIKADNEARLFPIRISQANRRQATHERDLEIARTDLQRVEVYPPFDGVLSEVHVELGKYLRAGDPIVKLIDDDTVEIPLPLTLADFARLQPLLKSGRMPQVEIAENEVAEPRWHGMVVRAAPVADEATRTILVYVNVRNDQQSVPLLPGTFVHARIDGPLMPKTLVVPRDAVIENRLFVAAGTAAAGRGDSPETSAAETTVERRTVQVRETLQSLAVVEAGLKPGDRVILTNLDVLHDGARIRIEAHRTLADELERERTRVVKPPALASRSSKESHP